jgi:hypothetical protein
MRNNNHEVTAENRLSLFKQFIARGRINFDNDASTKENPAYATMLELRDDSLVVSVDNGWYQLSDMGHNTAQKSGLIQFADFTEATVV